MRGFTLFELAMVTGLTTLLLGLGTSNVHGILEASRERQGAREVVEHLREARTLARSLAEPVTVSFGEELLYIQTQDFLRSYTLSPRLSTLSFNTEDGQLTFTARGGTTLTDPAILTITTFRGQAQTCTIYPAIGTIRSGT